MKVFVVFGSKSDENVSLPLVDALMPDFETEYEVISAHRDLEKLQHKMNSWQGDAVIAGAGLAAALPGVVAAMVKIPVFGVAVPSQFGGLDSFASIAQMPPGVPVMTAGPQKPEAIVAFLKKYKTAKSPAKIHFITRTETPDILADIEKARVAAREKGAEVTHGGSAASDAFNVRLVMSDGDIQPDDFCLHVPVVAKSDAGNPEAYVQLLNWSNKGGLWVGANNTRNAVHAALRLSSTAEQAQGRAA
ncbi:MAG TPA: AIR carboxylase family protein [Patescibacteria group bacterium]|nr:AIR carboxylase family protein [Patescibacteria group bacterium]